MPLFFLYLLLITSSLQSYSGFYIHDRQEALESIDNLLLNKTTANKHTNQQNQLFYIENLPQATFQPIQMQLPLVHKRFKQRYLPLNPSILKTKTGYKVILRTVNYIQPSYKTIDRQGIYRTRNYFIDYDVHFRRLSRYEIIDNLNREPKASNLVEGLEDCRLFELNGSFWFTCTTSKTSPYAFQMSACQLEAQPSNGYLCVKKLVPLQGPDPYRCEKNWQPFVQNNVLRLIYSYDPFIIYQPDLETGHCDLVLQYTPENDFSQFRGSAPPIEIDNGYLMLVHEVVHREGSSRVYLHRFLYLDENFTIQKLSRPFTFLHQGIEFCCSMTLDHSQKNLILPIGIEDREAYFCTIPLEQVRSLLKPLPIIYSEKPL